MSYLTLDYSHNQSQQDVVITLHFSAISIYYKQ